MSTVLSATPGPYGWRLRVRAAGAGESLDGVDELNAAKLGQDLLGRLFMSMGGEASTWQLEFIKATLGEGELALGVAESFALRCEANPSVIQAVRVPPGCLQMHTVIAAMRSRGLTVHGGAFDASLGSVKYLVATALAVAALLWTILRGALERNRSAGDHRFTIAVHGEDSNRTRHVLELFRAVNAHVRVLVLGRPRASLAEVQKVWVARHGPVSLGLERPFGIAAAASAAPSILASLVTGNSVRSTARWVPSLASLSGIVYRECLGLVSAKWWQAARSNEDVVVYGHTGLADTTHLEMAQQASGVRTIHAVHGLSGGLNFVGRSSVAFLRCRHDADWHERLGGYGDCRSVPMVQPSYAHGGDRLLLLSNYLHPMNLWFRMHGPRDELRMLDEVSRAIHLAGLGWSRLVWRPHPVFSMQTAKARSAVLEAAQRHGFCLWEEARDGGAPNQQPQVLCTPSSVAVDVMMSGAVPVVLDQQGANPDCAVRSLPFVATHARDLAEMLTLARDPVVGERAFVAAWRDIGPSGPLNLETLFQG